MEANPWLRERPRDPGTGRRPEVGVDDVVVLLVKLLQRYSDQDDELNGRQVALEPLLPQLPWFRGTPLLLRTDIGEEHVELLVQFIRAFGAFSSMEVSISSRTFPEIAALARKGGVVGKPREAEPTDGEATPEEDSDDDDDAGPPAVRAITLRIKNPDPDPSSAHPLRKEAWQSTRTDALNGSVRFGAKYEAARHANIYVHVFLGVPRIRFADLPEPFEGTELQVQAMIDAMQPLRIAPMHLLSLAMRMWFQFNERDSSAEEKAAWNNRKLKSVLSLPRGVNLIHSELIALTRKGLAGERLPDEDFATYLYRRYDAAAKAWLRGLEDPLPTRVWFTGVGYDPPGTRPWDRTDIGTFITTAEPRLVHFVMGSRGAGVTDLVDPAFVSFFRPPLDGAEVDRDVDDLAHVQGGEVQALDLEALGSGPPAKSLLTPRMTIHDLRTAAKAGPDVRIIDEAGRTAPQIQSRAKILLDGAERAKRPGRGRRKPVPHMTEPGQAADPGHLEPAYLTTPKKRKRGDGEEPLEDEDELLPPEKRINASMLTIPVRTSGMRQGRAEDRPKQAVNLLDDAAKLVVDPMKVSKVTIVSEAGRTNEAIPMWRRQHFARALTRQLNRTPEMRLKPQNRYMPPRDNPGECLIVSANVSRFSRRGSDYKHVDRNLRLQGDKLAIGMPDGSGYDIYDPSAPGADEMLAKFVDLAEKSNVHVKERSVASHAGAVKLRVLNSYRNEAASLYIDLMRKYLVPAVMRGFDNLLMVPRESPRGKKYFASSEDLGSSLLNTQLEFMELFFFYFAKHANCAVLPMDAVSAVGAGSLTKITTFVDEWMRGKTLVAATSVDRVSRHSKRYEVAENWFESREDGFLSLHVPMHVARRFPNARVMLDQMCGPANVATFELHFPNEFRDFMRILDSYFNLAEDTPKHLLIPFLHCGPAVSQGCEIARQITHELVKNAEGFSAPNLATRYPKRWKRPPPETVAKQGERREGTRELMALAERAALRYPRAVIDVHAPYNSKQTADVLTAKAVLRPEEGMDISDGEQGKDDPDKDSDSSSSSSSSSSGSDDSSGNPPRGGASGASGNGGGSDRDGPDRRRGSGAGNSGDKKRKKKKPGKRKRHEGSASEEAGSEGEEGEQNGAGGGKKGKSRKGKGSRGRRGDGHGHQHGHQHGLRKQEHRKCPGKCYKRPDGKCVCDVACVCNCEECDHRSELEVFPTEDPSFHGFDPNGPWPDPPPGGQPVAPRNGPAPAPSARASRQDRSPSPVSERAVTPRAAPRVPPLPAADPFALRSKEHPGRFKRLGSPPPESSDKKLAPAPRPVPVSLPMLGMYDSDYNSDAEDGADLPKPAADQASAAAPRARSASGDEILSDRDIFVDAAEDLLRSPSSAPRGADVRHAPPPTDGPKPASKEPADKPPQVKKRKFDEIADQPDDRASEEPADEPSKAKKPKVNEPADQHDEFKCGRCKMKLKSAEAFAKHQAMHDNPPYCCTICGKGYTRKSYRDRHEQKNKCKPAKKPLPGPDTESDTDSDDDNGRGDGKGGGKDGKGGGNGKDNAPSRKPQAKPASDPAPQPAQKQAGAEQRQVATDNQLRTPASKSIMPVPDFSTKAVNKYHQELAAKEAATRRTLSASASPALPRVIETVEISSDEDEPERIVKAPPARQALARPAAPRPEPWRPSHSRLSSPPLPPSPLDDRRPRLPSPPRPRFPRTSYSPASEENVLPPEVRFTLSPGRRRSTSARSDPRSDLFGDGALEGVAAELEKREGELFFDQSDEAKAEKKAIAKQLKELRAQLPPSPARPVPRARHPARPDDRDASDGESEGHDRAGHTPSRGRAAMHSPLLPFSRSPTRERFVYRDDGDQSTEDDGGRDVGDQCTEDEGGREEDAAAAAAAAAAAGAAAASGSLLHANAGSALDSEFMLAVADRVDGKFALQKLFDEAIAGRVREVERTGKEKDAQIAALTSGLADQGAQIAAMTAGLAAVTATMQTLPGAFNGFSASINQLVSRMDAQQALLSDLACRPAAPPSLPPSPHRRRDVPPASKPKPGDDSPHRQKGAPSAAPKPKHRGEVAQPKPPARAKDSGAPSSDAKKDASKPKPVDKDGKQRGNQASVARDLPITDGGQMVIKDIFCSDPTPLPKFQKKRVDVPVPIVPSPPRPASPTSTGYPNAARFHPLPRRPPPELRLPPDTHYPETPREGDNQTPTVAEVAEVDKPSRAQPTSTPSSSQSLAAKVAKPVSQPAVKEKKSQKPDRSKQASGAPQGAEPSGSYFIPSVLDMLQAESDLLCAQCGGEVTDKSELRDPPFCRGQCVIDYAVDHDRYDLIHLCRGGCGEIMRRKRDWCGAYMGGINKGDCKSKKAKGVRSGEYIWSYPSMKKRFPGFDYEE